MVALSCKSPKITKQAQFKSIECHKILAKSPAKAVKELRILWFCDKLVDDQKRQGWNVHVWLVNVLELHIKALTPKL